MSIEIKGELDLTGIPDMKPGMTPADRKAIWLQVSDMTEPEFDAMMAENKARQINVPEQGAEAPDFNLDVLDRETGRTGDKISLSSLRGKPVGLIFGSYT
jgi:hypothetical protein|tara:strand:+ start:1906 stop:2205 length:300 start_codon:yes stop_codon:yes gene_type:complete